ncbi:mannose-P-dolichol utilization defect 1 protein homolog 2-like isoform X2 [Asparagus officinalis]|uniref:mannose-P-dolichol utilization defect 1 protein homolog 2-like isoform X2 n=1 Tax=Asparagus officinalis TaxID=4686 RepID=UPI00098DF5DD|nr:mannose-P-dolichol utilization defect 1 protein homolog 2-like isoform X2 [Asparagus officinalis]
MMELEILGMNFGCILGPLSAGKFPTKDCLLPLISKILGYLIVAGSTTVKIPQIYKILKHNSVRGLSVAAFELEVVGYTIALAYCLHKGIPFSAYGELLFLLIQAIILVAIIYYYSQPVGAKVWMKAFLWFYVTGMHNELFNLQNKSVGELSFLTCFMNFAGSVARVFTSMQENTTMSMILGSLLAVVTNGTILSQMFIYWKLQAKKEKKVQ